MHAPEAAASAASNCAASEAHVVAVVVAVVELAGAPVLDVTAVVEEPLVIVAAVVAAPFDRGSGPGGGDAQPKAKSAAMIEARPTVAGTAP